MRISSFFTIVGLVVSIPFLSTAQEPADNTGTDTDTENENSSDASSKETLVMESTPATPSQSAADKMEQKPKESAIAEGTTAPIAETSASSSPSNTPKESTAISGQAQDSDKIDIFEKKEDKKKKKKKKKVIINARIHSRWELKHEDIPDNPTTDANEFEDRSIENDFSIRHARFKMSWHPEKWMTAVLQVDGFQKLDFGVSLLKDAYIHVSPLAYLEIRAGQFKKPFSRLALRSIGKLEVINRGESNDLLVEELRYGDRDLGIQFSGRIIPSIKLDYEIGVFNGNGPDISERGNSKDIVARIETTPVRWMDIGLNGSLKFFEGDENPDKRAWAGGADAVFKAKGFRAHVEGLFGLDHKFRNRDPVDVDKAPIVFGVLGILSYKHVISSSPIDIALEPVFKFELLDPNAKVKEDQVLLYNPGFNGYFGEYLRLMIHGEFRRPAVNGEMRYPSREALVIQICFDI